MSGLRDYGPPMFHMIRCDFCWREVKNTEAIHVGDNHFCSATCQQEYEKAPIEPQPRSY